MVEIWLKRIGFVAMVATVVLAFGQAALAADLSAGLAVYQKNACAACHGAKGEGAAGPAVSGSAFAAKFPTSDRLADLIRKGTGKGMPPYGEDKIGKADLDNLVAYIQSLTPAASAPPKAESAASEGGAPAAPSEAKAAPAEKAAPAAKAPAEPRPALDAQAPTGSAEAKSSGLTLEQVYTLVVAVLGVLLLIVFAVVLYGPLRSTAR